MWVVVVTVRKMKLLSADDVVVWLRSIVRVGDGVAGSVRLKLLFAALKLLLLLDVEIVVIRCVKLLFLFVEEKTNWAGSRIENGMGRCCFVGLKLGDFLEAEDKEDIKTYVGIKVPEDVRNIFLGGVTAVAVRSDGDTPSCKNGVTRESVIIKEPEKVLHLVGNFHVLEPSEVFGIVRREGFRIDELVSSVTLELVITCESPNRVVYGTFSCTEESRLDSEALEVTKGISVGEPPVSPKFDEVTKGISVGEPPVSPKFGLLFFMDDPQRGFSTYNFALGDIFSSFGETLIGVGRVVLGEENSGPKRLRVLG
ncbi:hypothetical protein FXO38_34747 [Capsicum annuum]|nr:hypothetical protein FXO38_34747 [Capsicum annuum]KAF3635507.1 hypothetical protein FXO37_25949 [Capsicum annuum]